MKYLRHITSVLVIILIAVLAAGTIVEKLHGSEYALAHVYSAWWFVGLWAVLAVLIIIMNVIFNKTGVGFYLHDCFIVRMMI